MASQRKLGKATDLRLALLKNQVSQLLWNGKLETTEARAKEVQKLAEKYITLAINSYKDTVEVQKTKIVNGKETTLTLPKSNVICFYLENGSSLTVRPSGTEPKIKLYIGAVGETDKKAQQVKNDLVEAGSKLLGF